MDNKLKIQVISGMIWRFAERICAQLVTFVVSIVLARLLEPSDYGLISLLTVFITIANVFVTDGFGKALIQKKEIDDTDYSSVFFFNIVFSWLVYGLIFVCAPNIASFYQEPLLIPTLRVLALKIPLTGIDSVQQAYVSRNMLFRRFFWSTILGTVLSAIVGIGMAYSGFGVWALVAQYLVQSLVGTLVLWFTVKWRPKLLFSFQRLKVLVQFGWKVLFTSLLNAGYDNLRSLIIGKRYTSENLAYYSKGIHYPNLIISNLNTTLGSVLFPALSKMQDDKKRLKDSLRRVISLSTYIVFPTMMGLAAVAPEIIELMLTEKWLPCVPYLRIACVYLAFYPINTSNLQAIMAVGKSDTYLKLNIIKKLIGIALVICSLPFGVLALAASEIIVALFAVFTNVSANKKLLNYSLVDLLIDIWKNVMMAIIMFIGVVLINKYVLAGISGLVVRLIFECITGVGIYLLLSILLKSKEYFYILDLIKKRIKG